MARLIADNMITRHAPNGDRPPRWPVAPAAAHGPVPCATGRREPLPPQATRVLDRTPGPTATD